MRFRAHIPFVDFQKLKCAINLCEVGFVYLLTEEILLYPNLIFEF